MSRPYSKEFIDGLDSKSPHRVGVMLAKECVNAHLPAKYVAKALKVSRATVHNWFRGAVLRGKNEDLALAFISLVQKDMQAGLLPAKSVKAAKSYVEDMIGERITG